jgi:predicted dehydrogenase
VDPSVSQRDIFESLYNLPAYPDIESALKVDIASLVIIASPTVTHCETINEVFQHFQPKAILCEKPLAYDLTEARKMVEVCQAAGVNLFVNYMRRADPGVIEVKNRIHSSYIAEPIKGFVWYSKGLLHNGSHFLNLLVSFVSFFNSFFENNGFISINKKYLFLDNFNKSFSKGISAFLFLLIFFKS